MAGTIEGARKASNKIKKTYGKDHYARIGRLGGQKSNNGGFASNTIGKDGLTGKERAIIAGRKGGKMKKVKSKV